MSVNVTKLEDNKVRMDVEVAPESVKRGVDAKVRELAKNVRVPGFRPGKAPRRVIESHLGRDYIFMEALQESLPNWYSDAVLKTRLRPIDRPEISFDDPLEEGKTFKFSATVEVRPEAELGEYKGVEVPKRKVEISDEDVDRQLEEFRSQFATLAAVEDRPVQEGDFVILDFKGPLEGAEAEDYMLEVGRGEFLEDFEKNLVGMQADERKQFGATFPMDYREESLRGQTVLFRVHVKEIKERELPPLDDEFAMEASEFETIEEFRNAVREQLREAAERQAEGEFRGRVLDVVAGNARVEVPEVMVEDRVREMIESFERNIQAQGIQAEQYYQIAQTNREEVGQQARPDAEDAVKKELVLDAVVKSEGIQVDEEAVLHEIEHLAQETGRKPKDLVKTMKNNGTFQLLEEEIARRQALDFLAENAVPTELREEDEADAEEEAETVESGEEQS
jgi:trigger factor